MNLRVFQLHEVKSYARAIFLCVVWAECVKLKLKLAGHVSLISFVGNFLVVENI
jgi:hypothetical protein